jgi:hypothetical protein
MSDSRPRARKILGAQTCGEGRKKKGQEEGKKGLKRENYPVKEEQVTAL